MFTTGETVGLAVWIIDDICIVFIVFQLLAAISVSTGCISYGICMAYSSSAIPSMLAANSTLLHINIDETTWMSK